MDLLREEHDEPRVQYYGVGDNYSGTPEDHRMIKKMKDVYRFLSKGRGKVQLYHIFKCPPLDVSYELPPLNQAVFLITYPTRRMKELGVSIEYMIDINSKAKYTFHNLETQRDNDMDRLMMHKNYEISYVYKKKFDKYGISISS